MAASIHPSLSLTTPSLISSTLSTNPTPTPNLASILKLDSSFTTCVGWARTQGRRCRNAIAYHNQAAARSVLAQGDQNLRAGQSVESVLHNVAPLLLCRRWHQDQACDVATKWFREVESYQESRRTVSVECQTVSTENLRGLTELIALLQARRRIQEASAATLTERQGDASLTSQPRPRQIQIEALEVHDRSEFVAEPLRGGQETLPQGRVESPTSEAPPVPNSSSQETDHVPEPVSAGMPSADEDIAPASSNISPTVEGSTPSATRKPIENNSCYICYEALLDDSQDGDSSEEMAPHLLVWCKRQCGVNFHRECMQKWDTTCNSHRNRTTTCPNCRATWQPQ